MILILRYIIYLKKFILIDKLKNKKCCNNLNKNRLQQYRVLQTRNNAETTLKISSHSWTRTNDPEMTNLEIFAEIILYRLYIRTLTN